MGYTKQVIRGVSWTGLLSFLTKSIGFIELIILARILSPVQFGAYAIALLVLGFMETITETGINIILLQEESIERLINSAWVVSILRGFIISSVIFLLAPFISTFFHSRESLILIYLISIVPLLRGFINPSLVFLQKELKFGKNFLFQASILLVDTVVSVILTYLTKNPIGIIWGLIAGVILELILSFAILRPRPRLSFEKTYIGLILGRGKWITINTISEYLFHNADNAVIARVLGAASLGFYQMAYSIAVMPLEEIGKVMVYVSTPVMIKISEDRKRLRAALLKVVSAAFLLGLPFALILIFLPKVALLVLGAKWEGILPILPVLAILGLLRAVITSSSSIFISLKQQKFLSAVSTSSFIVLMVLLIPLVSKFGNLGAALSAIIAALVALIIILIRLLR